MSIRSYKSRNAWDSTCRKLPSKLDGSLDSALGTHSKKYPSNKRGKTSMFTILIVVLVLLLIGALPAWPYSTGWGYYPSGGLGLVVIIVVLVLLLR
jgi:hypothetical protein